MGHKETEDGSTHHIVLTTNRLILRNPQKSDAPELAILANNWDIASNLANMPHPYGLKDAQTFLDSTASVKPPATKLAITLRSDGRFIGGCSLQDRNFDGEFEIGYWLGRPHWGRGFATEAVHALIDYGFSTAGLERLFVSCRVTNTPSRRVIHKSGFQPDGSDMIASIAHGGSIPVETYTLDRATWKALREWRQEDDLVLS